jgi:flagellar basal-body rod protein FlgB
MHGLFEHHFAILEKALDLRLERQNVVMANIANVNTPGYKARKLMFEEDLQAAMNQDARGKMARTNEAHLPSVFNVKGFEGKGVTDFKPRTVFGEDVVDLDKEMATMAKNSMMYNALSDVMAKNFSGLQSIIQEGGK